MKKHTGATFASRLMRWGGVTLLLFIIWHLLNFTVGKVNVTGGPTNDPYNLLVDTFDTWWLTLIYLVAMLALGAHLHHGIWSAAQTLGLDRHRRGPGDLEEDRVLGRAGHLGRLLPRADLRPRRRHLEVRGSHELRNAGHHHGRGRAPRTPRPR